jgi:SNF2 family DNA or RNA helicase
MTEILLTEEWKDRLKARSIPGAVWSGNRRAWVLVDPTPRGAAVALRLFPHIATTNPELLDLRSSLLQDVRPIDNATEFAFPIGAQRVRDALESQSKSFYDYQAIDLGYLGAVLSQHGSAYNGWERGLGKTLGACALLDDLDCQRSLVVCPNTAKTSVWAAELRAWCPWLTVVVLRNTIAQRLSDIATVLQLRDAGIPFVFVVHYDALSIIGNKDGWKKLKIEWDLIIADEVHRIANPDTKMARAIKKIPARRKLAMSGSIIQNHPQEMFSPLQWLFPDRYSSRWRDWNERYLDYIDGGHGKVCIGIKTECIPALRSELGVFMVVRRKSDVLDLPARTVEDRYVELSPAQRTAYRELLDQSFTILADGSTYVAADGLSLLTRLRQVASGLDTLGTEVTDSSKLDLVMEMIQDNEDQAFVVFTWYKANANTLASRCETAGIDHYMVTGDIPQARRAPLIDAFQAGGGRVFIGTIGTLGESVTLHRATNAVFIDRSWNPLDNDQAADRIYRIGQEQPVTITNIIARDTVDELRVMPILTDKIALRKAVLGG